MSMGVEREERVACNAHHSLELTHFCRGPVWCRREIVASLECVWIQLRESVWMVRGELGGQREIAWKMANASNSVEEMSGPS